MSLINIKEQLPFDGEVCWGYHCTLDEYFEVQYDEYYQCFIDLEDFKPILITHWKPKYERNIEGF